MKACWGIPLLLLAACGRQAPVPGSDSTVTPADTTDTVTAVSQAPLRAAPPAESIRLLPGESVTVRAESSVVVTPPPHDTVIVEPPDTFIPPPPVVVGGKGIPFGPFGLVRVPSNIANLFTGGMGSVGAGSLLAELADARARHQHRLVNLTGGSHNDYKTGGKFDQKKWDAKLKTYDTPAIKAGTAAAVKDGTLLGTITMDEPYNTSPENSWGPAGTVTKAMVDAQCGRVKQMFPTLPVGASHEFSLFEPSKSYRVCDFLLTQYAWRLTKNDARGLKGWIADALAQGKRDGIAIAFSMNVPDGGPKIPGCPKPQTGGPGTARDNCSMTPGQVRDWGKLLIAAGCSLSYWRYDAKQATPEYLAAFKDVVDYGRTLPAKSCRRVS